MFLLGCSGMKREALGSFNVIYAFVDEAEMDDVKEPLEITFERQIITPRPEKLFRINWGDTSSFGDATAHHIVLVAASLESPGHWGAFVRRSISNETRDSVRAGRYHIFVKRDEWASKQILIVLTARTSGELRDFILSNTDYLFGIVNDFCNENVALWLFGEYGGEAERVDVERKILREYGFGIRVPRMFDWEAGSGDEHFIWLRALEPERWIFVWWAPIDSQSTGKISLKWLRHIRDSLCAIYYEGDSIQEGSITYERTIFRTMGLSDTSETGLPALMYRARWRNSQKALGGPVVGFVMDDVKSGRRYIIDGAVFAPGVRKEPYIRHCEVIIRSFCPDTSKFKMLMKKGR